MCDEPTPLGDAGQATSDSRASVSAERPLRASAGESALMLTGELACPSPGELASAAPAPAPAHRAPGEPAAAPEPATAPAPAHPSAGEPAAAPAPAPALESLATELIRKAFELARLKPSRKVSESSRGLPAVMAELLFAASPLSPGELARRTGVTDARIANSLKALEGRGYIERHASSVDKRRVEVMLTPLGLERAQALQREAVAFTAGFLNELGEVDARELVRLLGRVVEVTRERREQGRSCEPSEACGFCEKGESGEDR